MSANEIPIDDDSPIRDHGIESSMAQGIRDWEECMRQTDEYAQRGEWEYSLKSANSALHICETSLNGANMMHYRVQVIDWLGFTYRSMGRFDTAREIMEPVLADMGSNRERVGICGELGVVYRHLDMLEHARLVFEDQYSTASQFGMDEAMCRAIGNLGMINYQISQPQGNMELLNTAIDQLSERVQRARDLRKASVNEPCSSTEAQYARTLEAIGLARLSLCYTAFGDSEKAVSVALESLKMTSAVQDDGVSAISRFFYGRALLYDRQEDRALANFNANDGCTCAIALCREPSAENRQYLQELLVAGADFDAVDAQGYTALDYTVFNDDKLSEAIVVQALRRSYTNNVERKLGQLQRDAELRKHYREIFQEKMRPILLNRSDDNIMRIRQAYSDTLDKDEEKSRMFDRLKYVPYTEFATLKRFPRSSDQIAHCFGTDSSSSHVDYIIFFSYRWLNPDPWANVPDDTENTQYLRTIAAVEDFLQLHPGVDPESLGIWIDYACINQDDPMSGVVALPMILAQCNALISLVDAKYYDRAWCSVEVKIMQALKKRYNLHVWFEQDVGQESHGVPKGKRSPLRKGSIDLDVNPTAKNLRFEEDRSKIRFLERQCGLLC